MTTTTVAPASVRVAMGNADLIGRALRAFPVGKRYAVPVLQCARVDFGTGAISWTDFDTWTTISVGEPVEGTGAVLVSAADLAAALKAQSAAVRGVAARTASVMLERDGDALAVSGPAGRMVVQPNGGKLEDYPQWPTLEPKWSAVASDGKRLAATVAQVSTARCRDMTVSQALHGVHATLSEGVLALAATNRYIASVEDVVPVTHTADGEALFPADVLDRALKLIGPVPVSLEGDGRGLRIAGSAVEVITFDGLRDGAQYPPIRRMFPTGGEAITLDRAALVAAVRSAGAMAPKNGPIILSLGGAFGSVREDVSRFDSPLFSASGAQSSWRIGFTPEYLLALLGSLETDRITLHIVADGKPVAITRPGDAPNGRASRLIMPCRLAQ